MSTENRVKEILNTINVRPRCKKHGGVQLVGRDPFPPHCDECAKLAGWRMKKSLQKD